MLSSNFEKFLTEKVAKIIQFLEFDSLCATQPHNTFLLSARLRTRVCVWAWVCVQRARAQKGERERRVVQLRGYCKGIALSMFELVLFQGLPHAY